MVLLLGGILAYLSIVSVILAWRAIDNLERGRNALVEARDEVASGSFADAASSFQTARYEFDAAHVATDNPFVAFMASLPLIGRTPDAIRTAAEAGLLVTDAGEGLSTAVERLKRGAGSTIVVGGTRSPSACWSASSRHWSTPFPRWRMPTVWPSNLATTFVPPPVADAGDELRTAVHSALSSLVSTDAILRALPAFTGMDAPRRYFLAPQDPSDLRGTGGTISYWAILKIDRGGSPCSRSITSTSYPTPTAASGRTCPSRRPTVR